MLDCYLHERREPASARSSQSHTVIGEQAFSLSDPLKTATCSKAAYVVEVSNISPEISYLQPRKIDRRDNRELSSRSARLPGDISPEWAARRVAIGSKRYAKEVLEAGLLVRLGNR
jgi:hypothetical protein